MVSTSISYWQKLLQQQTTKKIIVNITSSDLTKTVTSKTNSVMILNFKDAADISSFTYTRNGKNLLITNVIDEDNTQIITLKNYFSNKNGTATKSNIKYITYKNNTTPISIIDSGLILADYDFTPNKKGVVSGSIFSDIINLYDKVTKAYNKKGKGATINAGKGNDDITGTQFNDTITGGVGYNKVRFDYSKGFGSDTVKLTKGEILNLIIVDGENSVNKNALTYTKSGNNLVITRGDDTKNVITIKNYFKFINTAGVNINPIGNESSNLYDYLVTYTGVLNISGSKKIAGTIFNDNIIGSAKADTITSGSGNDIINAKTNNDIIKLGAGNKQLVIALNDGNDTVTLSNTDSIILNFANDVDTDKVVYARNKNDLYIYRENNQYTLIKNFFNTETVLKSNNGTTTTTINRDDIVSIAGNISANNVLSDTEGDDIIYGGNKVDKITVSKGNDTISLFKGNDTVTFVDDYADNTIVKTQGGVDNLIYKGQSIENLNVDKIGDNIIISTVDEDENISVLTTVENYKDITSTVNIKDKNGTVVKALKSGSGKISGTTGADIIIGSEKNDTITGGKGNDIIYTRGGSDTVVLSGNYGHDTIYTESNTDTNKVTLSLESLNVENIKKDGSNLVYTKNETNSVTVADFFAEDNSNVTDLWVKSGKNTLHIVNEKSSDADFSKDKNNNLVYMTSEDQKYTGTTNTKVSNIVYALDNNTDFEHKGGKEIYIATGEYNNEYEAIINSNSMLSIMDNGGDDKLVINNEVNDFGLYFNIDNTGDYKDSNLMFIKTSQMNYKNAKTIISGSLNGSIKVDNFYGKGKIESVYALTNANLNISDNIISDNNLTDNDENTLFDAPSLTDNIEVSFNVSSLIDIDGWTLYIADNVTTWLNSNNQVSTDEVLNKGSNSLKTSLLNLYKNLTYENYQKFKSTIANLSDITFVKNGDDLDVAVSGEVLETVSDYFTTATEPLDFWYIDENDNLCRGVVGSEIAPIQVSSTDNLTIGSLYNSVAFSGDFANTTVEILDGYKPVFYFNDAEYKDFYTKDDGTGHYTAGDPLIYKGGTEDVTAKEGDWKTGGGNIKLATMTGDDMTVNDITILNGANSVGEILIYDKLGQTKTILIGGYIDEETTTILNGTFESEIIIGSDGIDIINALGGDDLIYSGDGNDIMNFVKADSSQTPTGNNTAPMIVIGGSDYMPEHSVDSYSVYDTLGNDIYNTSLEVGLYMEDKAGDNDTINIDATKTNSTTSSLRYMFDIVNPNKLESNSNLVNKLYTDLFIYDKSSNSTMLSALLSNPSLEGLQGQFGYVWIDDYYSSSQKIEHVNLVNDTTSVELNLNYDNTSSQLYSTYSAIASWLAGTNKGFMNMFAVEGDYDTAWDVVRGNSTKDKASLMLLYQNNGSFI